MSLHRDLLEQAHHLCTKEPKKPKQASLRRAVSTAYYAVFHALIERATVALVPGSAKGLRPVLARVFDHKKIAEACKRLVKYAVLEAPPPKHPKNPTVVLPPPMGSALGGGTCLADLKLFAQTLPELQQARHEADYDLSKQLTKVEVIQLVENAKRAVDALGKVPRGNPHFVLLIIALFEPSQIVVGQK